MNISVRFLLLSCLFTLALSSLKGQQVRVFAEIHQVISNYGQDADYRGPDVNFYGNGRASVGNYNTTASSFNFARRDITSPQTFTINEVLVDDLISFAPGLGRNFDLCNDLFFYFTLGAFENDFPFNDDCGNADDQCVESQVAISSSGLASGVTGQRTIVLNRDFSVVIRFRYELIAPIERLETNVSNVTCAGSTVELSVVLNGNFSGGVYEYERRLQSGGGWESIATLAGQSISILAEDLNRYDYRARPENFTATDSNGNLQGHCIGDTPWTELPRFDRVITPSFANGIPIDPPTGSCGTTNDGSITYTGEDLGMDVDVVLRLQSASGQVFNDLGGPVQDPLTFTGLASGFYQLTAIVQARNASGDVINECTSTLSNIQVPGYPTVQSIQTTGQSPGCGQSAGTISATVTISSNQTQLLYLLYRRNGTNRTLVDNIPLTFDRSVGFSAIPGTYEVEVITNRGCVLVSETVNVGETPAPAGGQFTIRSQTADFDVACPGGLVDVEFQAPASEGPYSLLNFLDGTTQSVAAGGIMTLRLPAGFAAFQIERVNTGCARIEEFTISENPNSVTATFVNNEQPTACMGGAGSLEVEVTDGVAPFVFTLTPGGQTFQQTGSIGTFSGLNAGTYLVEVEDANGCLATTGATTLAAPASIEVTPTTTGISCAGETDGTINLFASGGVAPLLYKVVEIDNNFSTQTEYTDVAPGVYTVVVIDGDNCEEMVTVAVADRQAIRIEDITVQDVACLGQETNLVITVSGRDVCFNSFQEFPIPSLIYDVSLDGGVTYEDIGLFDYTVVGVCDTVAQLRVGAPVGDYQVILRDEVGCVSNQVTVSATDFDVPEEFVVTVDEVRDASCNGTNDGSITISVSGGRVQYLLKLSRFEGPAFFSNDAIFVELSEAGTYTFTGLSTTPPEGGYLLEVFDGTIPEVINEFGGSSDGGGISLKDAVPNEVCSVTLPLHPNAEEPFTDFLAVGEPSLLSITSIIDTGGPLNCDGSGKEVTVTASGGTPPYTYGVSNTSYTSSSRLSLPAISPTPRVYVRDANGCLDSLLFDDFVLGPSTLELNLDQPELPTTCLEGMFELTITGGDGPFNIVLFNEQEDTIQLVITDERTASFSGNQPGEYFIIVSDRFQCQQNIVFSVAAGLELVATLTQQTEESCPGDSDGTADITVSGGTPPYTTIFLGDLQTGANRSLSGLSPGNYALLVEDDAGCRTQLIFDITSEVIFELERSFVTPGPCVESENGTLTIIPSGGQAPYTLLFADDPAPIIVGEGGNLTLTNLASQEYQTLVTDANGCTQQLDVFLPGPDSIVVSTVDIVQPDCDGGGAFSIAVSGGSGDYLVSVNSSSPSTQLSYNNLDEGIYTIEVTDGLGCTNLVPLSIELISEGVITATAATEDVSCSGASDGTITIVASGSTEGLLYSLDGGTPQSSNQFTGLSGGTYTVVISSSGNCGATVENIVVNENTAVEIQPQIISDPCTERVTVNLSASGGAGGYEYAFAGGAFSAQTSYEVLANGVYDVSVRDAEGCTVTTTVVVSIVPLLTILDIVVTDSECGSGQGQLAPIVTGGTPPYSFQWSGGGPTDSLFTGVAMGDYFVQVSDAAGCEVVSVTVTVRETPPVTFTAAVQDATCGDNNGIISLEVPGGPGEYTFSWENGVIFDQNVASGLSPGNYGFTITRNTPDGCFAFGTATIGSVGGPNIVLDGNVVPVRCDNPESGSAAINITGGTPLFAVAWSNGETGSRAVQLPVGENSVTVTDANNCTAVLEVFVSQAERPTLIVDDQTAVGCGDGNFASATVFAFGGSAPYNYVWSSGVTDPTATNLLAGLNTITVTDEFGCTASLTVDIEQLDAPILTLESSTLSGCNELNFGAAMVSVSGGTPGYVIDWSNGAIGQTAEGLPAGTYTVTVTDAANCTDEIAIVIEETASPVLELVEQTPAGCDQQNLGTAIVIATGPGAPFFYDWSNGEIGPQATQLSPGEQSVTVTDAFGCTNELSLNIESSSTPIIEEVLITDAVCTNGNGSIALITTGGSGMLSYSWSHDVVLNAPTAENLPGGTYAVTITDEQGCSVTEGSIEVTFSPGPTVQIAEVIAARCGETNGQISINATGTPPLTYTWTDEVADGPTAMGLLGGDYAVTVTDGNGCERIVNTEVPSQPILMGELSVISDALCGEATGSLSVTITSGTAPFAYRWSHNPELGAGLAVDLVAGDYGLTISDNNGCETVLNQTITGSPALTIANSEVVATTCSETDGSIIVNATGGTGTLTYSWSHDANESGPIVSGLSGGIYTLSIVDELGCTVVTEFTVGNVEGPQIESTSVLDTRCTNDNGSITLNVAGGALPYDFNWSHDPDLADNSAAGLPAGEYSVLIIDDNGCTVSANLTIDFQTGPTLELAATNPACGRPASGTIIPTVTGGTPPLSYSWNNSSSNPVQTDLRAGDYTLTVSDANGCSTTGEVTLSPQIQPSITIEEQLPVACPETAGSVTFLITNVEATTSYTFSEPNAPLMVSDLGDGTARLSVGELVAASYTLTVESSTGCTAIETVDIGSLPEFQLVIEEARNISCQGETDGLARAAVLNGTGEYAYNWSASAGDQTTAEATNLPAGTHLVTAISSRGCTDQASVTIIEPALLSLEEDVNLPPNCDGDADGRLSVIAGGGTPPYTYTWAGDTLPAEPVLTGLAAGTYTLTLTDANGCTLARQYVLEEGIDLVIPGLTTDTTICRGNFFVLDLSDFPERLVSNLDGFESTEEIVLLESAGDYSITVGNASGCIRSYTTRLNVTDEAFTARMIVASDGVVDVPLVVLEASLPAPELVQWVYDEANASIVDITGNLYSFVFTETGTYNIGLIASAGNCEDVITKTVIIHADSTSIPGIPLGSAIIQELIVSPNPNTGAFTVEAALSTAQPFTLTLYRDNGTEVVRRRTEGITSISEFFNLTVPSGTYLLQAQAGHERRVVPVLIR